MTEVAVVGRVDVVEEELTRSAFVRRFQRRQVPVLLKRGARRWGSSSKWDFEYFEEIGAEVPVKVSMSNEERSPTVKRTSTLAAFAAHLRTGRADEKSIGSGDDDLVVPLYLKQFDLMSAFPRLQRDVDFSLLGTWVFRTYYGWMGPSGASTGLHSDDEDNMLACIKGSKRLVLFPVSDRPYLYVNGKYDSGTECCDVDPMKPDLKKFPLYARARPLEVLVEEGDVLFIPKYWWHCVRNESSCIAVNCFVSTPLEMLYRGIPRTIGEYLHNIGLYHSKEYCVCHSPGKSGGSPRTSTSSRNSILKGTVLFTLTASVLAITTRVILQRRR